MKEGELLSERYNTLVSIRKTATDRAEDCAKFTLPYAFTEETFKAQDDLDRYYTQGFGAELVNHLVGKLALSILPPSQPFYRLSATQEAMEAVAQGNKSAEQEIEKLLATKEEGIMRNINKSNLRGSLYPALRLAVITGSSMLERTDTGYDVINLRNYVVSRDYSGKVLEFIIHEKKTYLSLDEEFKQGVEEDKKDEDVDLYTAVLLQDDGKYLMRQELMDKPVGKEQTLSTFEDKFIDVGWNRINGEDYPRGFVEDHLGTFIALEKITTVVYEGLAESVKIIKMVNPNGLTTYEDFVGATHGEAIIGSANDITTVQSGKTQDLRVAKELIAEMKQELARAFLVTGSSIRDSERTTAAEVSIVAQETEASLGGIYTSISDNIQRPAVLQAMKDLKIDTGKDVDVIITTGLQALGRNVELSKINGLIQELQMLGQIVGAEAVAKVVNVGAITASIVANSGVASKSFLYTEDEIARIKQAQGEEAMAQQAMQGALPQVGQNLANQATGEQQ